MVVANPPYMGSSSLSKWMGAWVKKHYPEAYRDLCTSFIDQGFGMSSDNGYSAMVTMQSWMFLGSFEKLRGKILRNHSISSMAHLGTRAFGAIGGEVVSTTATVFTNAKCEVKGAYFRLVDMGSEEEKQAGLLEALADPDCGWFYRADAEGFGAIPGSPIAYWATDHFIDNCREGSSVSSYACFTGSQNITADNAKYVRFSWEVSLGGCSEQGTWVPYAKGGGFRRWFGNIDSVVNWSTPARSFYAANKTSNLLDNSLWYSEGITYTDITSGKSHFRYLPNGCVFDKAGPSIVCFNLPLWGVLGLFNSSTAQYYFDIFNPTLHLQTRDVKAMPIKAAVNEDERIQKLVVENVRLSQLDWDSFECSKGFKRHPLF